MQIKISRQFMNIGISNIHLIADENSSSSKLKLKLPCINKNERWIVKSVHPGKAVNTIKLEKEAYVKN